MSDNDLSWAGELASRGQEVSHAADRFGPDTQWTIGFGLVGLGLAIAIRGGIRAETQRARALTPVTVPPPPSRLELLELHEQRAAELRRQLEQGEGGEGGDGES
jgi:hypothetical protein